MERTGSPGDAHASDRSASQKGTPVGKSPLPYLGLHLPELRTVDTTWNLHAYDHRKRVPHKEAEYIQLKITATALDRKNVRQEERLSTLSRHAWIRTQRPRCQGTADEGGVVEFGHYAIRMTRQDYAQLRSMLQSQSTRSGTSSSDLALLHHNRQCAPRQAPVLLFCTAIYGPPVSYAHSDPVAIRNSKLNAAAQ